MLLGLSGMVFGMASEKLSMIQKIPVTIFCFVIMMIGVLIESGIVNELRNKENELKDFDNN